VCEKFQGDQQDARLAQQLIDRYDRGCGTTSQTLSLPTSMTSVPFDLTHSPKRRSKHKPSQNDAQKPLNYLLYHNFSLQ
jgi:hypothetical protein